MPRKPITQLMGGQSPRQRVWDAIRGLAGDGTFTSSDLSRACKIGIDIVRTYLAALTAGGWLIVQQGARGINSVYRLEKDNGIEAPRVRRDGTPVTQGGGNGAMWRAISILDNPFTAQVLSDITGAPLNTAKSYCAMLAHAGYLAIVEEGKGLGKGGKPTQWRTIRSSITGPRAPMITRLKAVYDPNLHKIMWMEGEDEAAEEMDHA